MYLPRHFAQHQPDALHALMRAQPLATVVLADGAQLDAEHLPLLLHAGPDGACLRGHVPRAHPLAARDGATALAIFHGPEGYVSPSWYPSKVEHHRAVPTWNYAVVHAYGRLRRIDDRAWLFGHLHELTAAHEASMPAPWHVDDAPADYLDTLLAALVGIEIAVERLEGKFKLSQNQPAANCQGVIAGLRRRGQNSDARLADWVAAAHEAGRTT